jgi:hypothetical protein
MFQVSVNEVSLVLLLLESSNGLPKLLLSMGCPASPFIDQGEGMGYMREKDTEREQGGKNREGKGPRVVRSFFSYRRVPPVL